MPVCRWLHVKFNITSCTGCPTICPRPLQVGTNTVIGWFIAFYSTETAKRWRWPDCYLLNSSNSWILRIRRSSRDEVDEVVRLVLVFHCQCDLCGCGGRWVVAVGSWVTLCVTRGLHSTCCAARRPYSTSLPSASTGQSLNHSLAHRIGVFT